MSVDGAPAPSPSEPIWDPVYDLVPAANETSPAPAEIDRTKEDGFDEQAAMLVSTRAECDTESLHGEYVGFRYRVPCAREVDHTHRLVVGSEYEYGPARGVE